MPTLSIIKSGNKCAVTYMGEENEITRMLTQCGLQDELLAEAIIQSALSINQTMIEHQSKLFDLEKQQEESEL
jgi:hypothetical protein